MRKTDVIAAVICAVFVIIPLKGWGTSAGMSQHGPRLTAQDAISEARRHAQKPGSSFTVLREIVANADTRRIGDHALEQAKARHIKLYENGILADFLRSGGFLVAETEPRTNKVSAIHLVSLEPDGAPNDVVYRSLPFGPAKLADVEGLVKATAEFTEAFYSTPPSEATSLESKFYGRRFPQYDDNKPDYSLFAVPLSLLKLGADPSEVREAEALVDSLTLFQFQYAVSMPDFSANPLVATQTAEEKWEALQAEFLRNNHMNPDSEIDLENLQSKEQLRERIDLLRRLDKFLEEALKSKTDPALVKANISVAAIPLGVSQADPFYENGKPTFSCATANLLVLYWQPLPTGGFAVYVIGMAG